MDIDIDKFDKKCLDKNDIFKQYFIKNEINKIDIDSLINKTIITQPISVSSNIFNLNDYKANLVYCYE